MQAQNRVTGQCSPSPELGDSAILFRSALPTDSLQTDSMQTGSLYTDSLKTDSLETDLLQTDSMLTDSLRDYQKASMYDNGQMLVTVKRAATQQYIMWLVTKSKNHTNRGP